MPRANLNHFIQLLKFSTAATTICIFTLTMLLVWIAFTPHFPSFRVTSLTVSFHTFNITQQPTESFHVGGILQNPNLMLSICYDSLSLVIWFNNMPISLATLQNPLFSNGAKTDTPIQAQFEVAGTKFPSGAVGEIAAQRRGNGSINFGVTLTARLRFKFYYLSSRTYFLALNCYPLQVAFSLDDNMSYQNVTGTLFDRKYYQPVKQVERNIRTGKVIVKEKFGRLEEALVGPESEVETVMA
ncbi:unnamed protein product [Sphenostylis stenocarpa]|uniref:Late embryogenesis abundant protein LEA-2 subgroup domain-containing protein n=1 Tax=Sphenostylis stenocarpa TaxID=92480 RepID=A0AA86VQH9_9FABA|nr:unnamed protein product [Sphenostylis stenocarpa]